MVPGSTGPGNPVHPVAEVRGAETPGAVRRRGGGRSWNGGRHPDAVRNWDADGRRFDTADAVRHRDGVQNWSLARHPGEVRNCDSVRHPGETHHSGAEEIRAPARGLVPDANRERDRGPVGCPNGLAPDADPIPDEAVRHFDKVGVHPHPADGRRFDTGDAVRQNGGHPDGG